MWFAYDGCGISLGRNVVENKMLVMLVDSGKVSFANLGHVEWTSCTTRRLAWSLRDLQHWSFAEDPERK